MTAADSTMAAMGAPLKRIARNFGLALSGQAMATGLGFATLMVNSRALGVQDLGRLFLIQATCELVSKLIAFQNWQSFAKVGADIEGRGSLMALWRYGQALDFGAALLAMAVSAMLLLAMPGLIGLDAETGQLGLLYAVSLLLVANGTSVGALRLFDAYVRVEGVHVLQAALLLANAVVLYVLDLPLWAYLVSIPVVIASCGLLVTVLGYLRVRACDPGQPQARFDRAVRRRFLHFAFGVSASSTLTVIRQRGEILIVGAILGPMAAALYGVAYRVGALLARFAEAARISVYPEFSRMVASRRFPEAARLAVRLARWIAVPAAAVILAAAAAGEDILALLFGPEYRAAAPSLVLLALGSAIYASIFGFVSLVQIAFGSWRFFILNLCAFIGFAVFAVLGPAWFGVAGAGAGAVVFSTILAALCVMQVRRGLSN